jgi:hypothetical protein
LDRRDFLTLLPFIGVTSYFLIKNIDSIEKDSAIKIIKSIQNHIFPKDIGFISADEFEATNFLIATTSHRTFDNDIKKFIFQGARKIFFQTDGTFIDYSHIQKERFLENFQKNIYGELWLSNMINITLEAMLCDKIYSSNNQVLEILNIKKGNPKPIKKYIYD